MNRRSTPAPKPKDAASGTATSGLPDAKLFRFLKEIEDNNDRDWFAENKLRYRECILDPCVELLHRLEKPLARAAPMIEIKAKAYNGSIMRVYRDTRFSKDKRPLKTNVGLSLRHAADQDIHAPGFYVHFANDECFVGGGCWRPPRDSLAAIRSAIDRDPKAWKRATQGQVFRKHFTLGGDSLKTAPRDYPKDHPLIEDLRRIDFVFIAKVQPKQLLGDLGIETITGHIKAAKPMMKFLCAALEVPY